MLVASSNHPLVAVRIALSRLGIHHTFAAHQTVIFVGGSGVQGVVFGLALDGVGLGRHVVGQLGLVLESPVPVAFPHLHHHVPAVSQRLDFGLGGAIGILHAPVQ